MILPRLPMGCLSSRSTIVPSERVENAAQKSKLSTKHPQQKNYNSTSANNIINEQSEGDKTPNGDIRSNNDLNYNGDNSNNEKVNNRNKSPNSRQGSEDDITFAPMNDQEDRSKEQAGDSSGDGAGDNVEGGGENSEIKVSTRQTSTAEAGDRSLVEGLESTNPSIDGELAQIRKSHAEGSFDEELSQELLRDYVAIDYEITQLEDKDALRVYHEKIEQLEQLERELDMISQEAEEVAARSETGTQLEMSQLNGSSGPPNGGGGGAGESKMDMESNSILSGATGSMSRKSWMPNIMAGNQQGANNNSNGNNNNSNAGSKRVSGQQGSINQKSKNNFMATENQILNSNRNLKNLSYSTVEEVFNRKIILEKERDKLKKEVEMVIIECDKLQQRYKKRDEILDKLFDGRTGNGLENHLEQQLNWLLEQKHYVDQVFYAWKRAETLNSQTCEQFTSALELLKRLPKVDDTDERSSLIKRIGDLLIKSRKDIEQAQQYNPNVDAPFFTDNETERFDKIIESISSNTLSESEYSQVLTVIQFAYKRAVNIRLWLEQILQTTIARDSFELAEEYKWIAIQLRKERINLIRSKLQNPKYQPMVQSVLEQKARPVSNSEERRRNENNRDSGIDSETNDIEEEIYRLLESNRSRLEIATSGGNQLQNSTATVQQQKDQSVRQVSENPRLRVTVGPSIPVTLESSNESNKKMRQRIQKRAKGDLPPLTDSKMNPVQPSPTTATTNGIVDGQNNETSQSIGTPSTRVRIELDEEARQSLLEQVNQIHMQHKNRIEKLKGNNRAKAADSVLYRMQQMRGNQTGKENSTNS